MTFRYRKSIQIIPGLRMNIGRRGVGYSIGGQGLRLTRGANGRVTRTIGIPGTGMSSVSTVRPARFGARGPAPATSRSASPSPSAPPAAPHPSLFAPGWEKHLFRAMDGGGPDLSAVAREYGAEHPDVRVLAAALDGLSHFAGGDGFAGGDPDRARELLGWAIAQGVDLKNHPFVRKYLTDRTWPVEIADGIVAYLGIEHDVVLLAEAELHQAAGDPSRLRRPPRRRCPWSSCTARPDVISRSST